MNENKKFTAIELGKVSPSFIELMRDEIDKNAHKGDWNTLNLTKNSCLAWLREHTDKLNESLHFGTPAQLSEHTADIANIVMKIQELYGK